MKIYTRSGDDGTTSLAGGERTPKYSSKIEAYGTVDELISWLGLILAIPTVNSRYKELNAIQDKLMHCAALLSVGKGARTDKMIPPDSDDIKSLEKSIDLMEGEMQPLTSFIMPGGSVHVAYIHIARTVCRRAERNILRLAVDEEVDDKLIKYINRLSDYLFVLARKVSVELDREQSPWNP
jgi:cob(I)alamin adenosyltransferase